MAWICLKCNQEMELVEDIALNHGDMTLPPSPGGRCPVCNTEYLFSDYVVTELNQSEQMLEGK